MGAGCVPSLLRLTNQCLRSIATNPVKFLKWTAVRKGVVSTCGHPQTTVFLCSAAFPGSCREVDAFPKRGRAQCVAPDTRPRSARLHWDVHAQLSRIEADARICTSPSHLPWPPLSPNEISVCPGALPHPTQVDDARSRGANNPFQEPAVLTLLATLQCSTDLALSHTAVLTAHCHATRTLTMLTGTLVQMLLTLNNRTARTAPSAFRSVRSRSCPVSHLPYVTSALCHICPVSHLPCVTAALSHCCPVSHLPCLTSALSHRHWISSCEPCQWIRWG